MKMISAVQQQKKARLRKPGWGTGIMGCLGSAYDQWPRNRGSPAGSTTSWCFEDSYHDTTLGMGRHLNWHYIELAKKFGSFCNISWKNPNKDFGQTSILFYLCTTGIVNSFRGEKKSNDIPYNLKFEGFICPMDHLDEKGLHRLTRCPSLSNGVCISRPS